MSLLERRVNKVLDALTEISEELTGLGETIEELLTDNYEDGYLDGYNDREDESEEETEK